MRSLFTLISAILSFSVVAQTPADFFHLWMDTQVVQGEEIIWEKVIDSPVEEGKPVNVKLTGNNFKMMVRLSCMPIDEIFMILTVQSETLLRDSKGKVNFYSNMRSIKMPYSDHVIYYPLGGDPDNATDEAINAEEPLLRLVLLIEPDSP